MAHIHTEPGQHDFTVSAFIFRIDFDEPKIILHMHKKLHKWLQFGGHIELHENPWQALEHEILEESGYDMAQLQLLTNSPAPLFRDGSSVSHPIPFSINTHPFSDEHSHTDLSYAFTTTEDPKYNLAKNESQNIQMFTKEEFLKIPSDQIPENVRDLTMFAFDNLLGSPNKNVQTGVGVFVWRNGQFLMGRRRNAHGNGTWSIPGGHIEFGESWEDCAKREVLEETGMLVSNVRFLAATNDIFENEDKHYTTIWVECDWEANEPQITEPDKYVGMEWRTFSSLPSPLFIPWEQLKLAKPNLFS